MYFTMCDRIMVIMYLNTVVNRTFVCFLNFPRIKSITYNQMLLHTQTT